MPTPTFWNLPVEKREAFIGIALDEFAENDYTTASVSRIVVRAGIAKGSVYQYFADKRELFLYLLDVSSQTLLQALEADTPSQGDFFSVLRWQMSATTRAALAHPVHARLIQRAFSQPLPFQDDIARKGRETSRTHMRQLLAAGIERGELAPHIDLDLAALVIAGALAEIGPHIVKLLGLDTEQAATVDPERFVSPEFDAVFDGIIRIFKHGLAAQPKEEA